MNKLTYQFTSKESFWNPHPSPYLVRVPYLVQCDFPATSDSDPLLILCLAYDLTNKNWWDAGAAISVKSKLYVVSCFSHSGGALSVPQALGASEGKRTMGTLDESSLPKPVYTLVWCLQASNIRELSQNQPSCPPDPQLIIKHQWPRPCPEQTTSVFGTAKSCLCSVFRPSKINTRASTM